ncbi:MAG TPA: PadR family transcriptional regulator [Longimicrobiales bacterium]|nr:PadR family transcriptional regulator [Longimicrobiales bacterium]
MTNGYVGEFEQMVLLSIMRLGSHAYGLAVRDELEQVAGRSPSSGSLYTTLDRMERKGLITSTEGETSGERGGRPRRYLAVTPEGRDALARSRSTLLRLWDGLESALDRP